MTENESPKDYDVYNFKDSGDGKSWLLGTDSSNWGNAFRGGYQKCPVDIIVPRELKDEKGETRPVEVIGQWAYYTCGDPNYGDKTKTVLVTKQVRVIKRAGFGAMHNVESFRIEEGSVLQSIEQYGLNTIGFNTGKNDAKKRGTLTLPSTLSSVSKDGIYRCNLFKIIIYCGTHSLTEECDLENEVSEETKVKVTNQYSGSTIFGRTPLYDSPEEVQDHCLLSDFRSEPLKEDEGVVVTGWGNTSKKWCPNSFSIPDFIDGLPVRAINESAFENCSTGGEIVLPHTLKKVGAKAFAGTANVTAILASSNELEIGAEAFSGCGLEANQSLRIVLPPNVQLNESAFLEANIGELYIS